MEPYYAATAGDPSARKRAPVLTLFDIDHSDFCETFDVPHDLPSDTTPAAARARIANASAAFMLYHGGQGGQASAGAALDGYLAQSETLMAPLAAAFDLERGAWCEAMQNSIAGSMAGSIRVQSSYTHTRAWGYPEPTYALAEDGVLNITVSAKNVYEVKKWPPGSALESAPIGAPPPVSRNTAGSLGCKTISAAAIAAALGLPAPPPPADVCKVMNEKAWAWGLAHAAPRTLVRYRREAPCNNCTAAAAMVYAQDTADVPTLGGWDAAQVATTFDARRNELTVQSPVKTAGVGQYCKLLSPARVLDILQLDAFQASLFP